MVAARTAMSGGRVSDHRRRPDAEEMRVNPPSLAESRIDSFVQALGSASPAPGGGAAAALCGAQAAALGLKACALTVGKPRFAAVEPQLREAMNALGRARDAFLRLMDEDAAAYGELNAAFRLAKSEPGRAERIAQAATLAAMVPLEALAFARQVRALLDQCGPATNPQLHSDVAAGRHMAECAAAAAAENVRVNLPWVPEARRVAMERELAAGGPEPAVESDAAEDRTGPPARGWVYLDNNASTPLDPRVRALMHSHLEECFGNPSSAHRLGARVAAEIEHARSQVAELIGAKANEIIFTSGGTEANNLALRGLLAAQPAKRHIVISSIEHHAVHEPVEELARAGYEVTHVAVDVAGRLDLDGLKAALRDDTALLSIMLANNETGVVLPVADAARLAAARGVPLHTDAVNALGKVSVRVDELGVAALSLSAHKIHGPKGVGALYVRRDVPFRPPRLGGPQERDHRGGTPNTAGIVALGLACELLRTSPPETNARMRQQRDRLERGLLERCAGAQVIGSYTSRVPNTTCICFPDLSAEVILMLLSERGVCASSGAACASGASETSRVLRAMGVPPRLARGQVRLSLSRLTLDDEVDRAMELVAEVVARLAGQAQSG